MSATGTTRPDGLDAEAACISRNARATRRRVLVCEDDPSILAMVRAVLSRGQFEVVSAVDGVETMARLDEPFDVIVLDLMMPSKSGFDVLNVLAETNPALLKRVLVVTAHTGVRRRPLRVPVAGLLIKPFDIVEFLEAVTRVAGDSS